MKKSLLVSIVFVCLILLSVGYYVWSQQILSNDFIVVVDKHKSLNIKPNAEAIKSFINTNIPTNSRIVTDINNGPDPGIQGLEQVRIIFTDEIQDNLQIIYPSSPQIVQSSNISRSGNTLILKIHVNEAFVNNSEEADWFFTSSLAQTILFIRDSSRFPPPAPQDIIQYYRSNMPTSEVMTVLQSKNYFASISKK